MSSKSRGSSAHPSLEGFGLIAIDHLPKPSFNVFRLLHTLGDQRIPEEANDVLVTKEEGRHPGAGCMESGGARGDGGPTNPSRSTFQGVKSNAAVSISRIDQTHGNVLAAYDKMGAPAYPSQEQLRQLREVERPVNREVEHLHGGSFTLVVPAQGLAVVEVGR